MRRPIAILIALCLTIACAAAWAFWGADSVPGGNGAAAAPAVNQGATPTASVSGQSVTVSWAATTLTNGQAVAGYQVTRYDAATSAAQTILSACTGTVAATSCVEANVPAGSWKYAVTPVIGANWRGAESAKSSTVTVVPPDTTAPTNALSLSSVTGGAFLTGTTVFYRGTAAGSLSVTNAVSDAGSGPADSATGTLSGTTTGWAHTPSTVSAPAGGPYVSNPFTWAAATTSSPQVGIAGHDVAGNTTATTLSFANDSTAPTSGSITYAGGFAAGRSATITFTTGTDAGSGIATRQLQRATAPLTGGTCDSYGAFANIGTQAPTSPYVDTQLAAACHKYRYVVTDQVGNQAIATNANEVKVGYAGAVNATAGLLSHWRLGEGAADLGSSDSFSGTPGQLLTARAGEVGATWGYQVGSANTMRLSSENRARRNGTGYSVSYTTAVPATPDYSVEADLYVKSFDTYDAGGVVGRLNTGNSSFYMARWETDNTWNIVKWSGGTPSWIGTSPLQSDLTPGQSYRLKLEISGSSTTTLKLYVNGALLITGTDAGAPLTAAGKAGIMDGEPMSFVSKSDTTGIHFDNFQVNAPTYPRALDDKGTNHGDYKNGPTLGVSGALNADANTAAQFDGLNDYVQMTGTTGLPVNASSRSVELWFKTSSAARQVLFSYGARANNQEFGLWLDSGGTSMTAWGFGGGNDKTFALGSAVNDGSWHHVVKTYNGSSITLYIDGVALVPQTATRSTVMDAYGFGIGAVINQLDGNSGGFFAGWLDEVSFYTTALSQATITDHYQLGMAAAADLTGPTGGSVDATGLVGTGSRYSTTTTLNLALVKGTDPSGLPATGNQLLRATAPLASAGSANGVCGTFGGYTLVPGGDDPTTPKSDTVTDQACYKYRYVVLDTIGNSTTYTSPDIKVDTTAPASPTLSFTAPTNAYWPGSGTTVYYRSSASSGGFTVTASATDTASGIASYAFPALGTNWTSTPGSLGVNAYTWSGTPAAPGTKQVTATNHASSTSATSPVILTDDATSPSAGTVTYADGATTSTSVSVSFTTGTDAGSGVGTRLLQRSSAPLTGTSCGTFGAFATVAGGTNPTAPFTDTVALGSCYKYQYAVADNVGNTHTASSASVVKVQSGTAYFDAVSATTGLLNYYRMNEVVSTSPIDDIRPANNNGAYFNGPTMGQAGAPAGSADTAAQFDGVDDYGSIARQVSDNFSIEFWFKSTQGIGTGAQWWQGAGLVDAEVSGAFNDFGVSLRSDGRVVAGVGTPDVSLVSSSGGYNNGTWHHVVFTRTQVNGSLTLYVDGVATASGTGSTVPLTAAANISFGRLQTGVNYYQGLLDEVAIYNTVLSPATIAAHYTAAQ